MQACALSVIELYKVLKKGLQTLRLWSRYLSEQNGSRQCMCVYIYI